MHVADLTFRAGHRMAPAEPVVPHMRLGVAFEHLAEDEQVLLAAVGNEAVADLHDRLPRLDLPVGRLHRLAQAGLGLFERVEELNLHGHHLVSEPPRPA